MKKISLMALVLVVSCCLVALSAQFLAAQERGQRGERGDRSGFGGMRFGNAGEAVIENTANGVFVLKNGLLAKFDAKTLKAQGAMLSLFGAMPAAPAEGAGREAYGTYAREMARRAAPPVMIVNGDSLLVVVADGFARINQATLKVEAQASLKPQDGSTVTYGRPSYKLSGDTLYLMMPTELLAVDIKKGEITQRGALPKEMQPQQPAFGGNRGAGR